MLLLLTPASSIVGVIVMREAALKVMPSASWPLSASSSAISSMLAEFGVRSMPSASSTSAKNGCEASISGS